MPKQLTFDLPVRTALGRDDFFVSEANADAVAKIEGWRDWPQGKLALGGPAGSGKTHLAHVWAEMVGAPVVPAAEVATLDPGAPPGPLAIDGLDGGLTTEAETTLFHVHNAMMAAGQPLLLTGRDGPARWPIKLPDLASRLSAADTVRIAAPDDAVLAAVLLKLFSDRQLRIAPAVISYLIGRMERSFAEAHRLATGLDAAALAEGRPVTRALAARILDEDSGS